MSSLVEQVPYLSDLRLPFCFCFIGYKTLEVIKGHQHAYVHTTLIKKWDICAGNAILNALDGKMTTLEENFIDYRSGKEYKNDKGLLATVYNHQEYLDKLKSTLKS